MHRRRFLVAGAALGVAVTAGDVGGARLAPAATPRSDRPHGPRVRTVDTRVVWHAAPRSDMVALTFDDGPDPRWTPMVLDLLARHRVPATFYVVGERAARHRDLLARAVDSGHEIGNHTWSHIDLAAAAPGAGRDELFRTSDALERLTGHRPATLRPPWGSIDTVGLLAAADLGCTVVLWSELIRASQPQADLGRSVRDARPGSVLLAHDGGPTPTRTSIDAVEAMLVALRDRGFSFGTVSELLAEPTSTPDRQVTPVVLPEQRGS